MVHRARGGTALDYMLSAVVVLLSVVVIKSHFNPNQPLSSSNPDTSSELTGGPGGDLVTALADGLGGGSQQTVPSDGEDDGGNGPDDDQTTCEEDCDLSCEHACDGRCVEECKLECFAECDSLAL